MPNSVSSDQTLEPKFVIARRRQGRTLLANGPYADVWRSLRQNPSAVFGGTALGLLVLVALFSSQISPYDPYQMAPVESLHSPSLEHWMGTDEFGRDILSRVLAGARISLQVGVIAAVISVVFGIVFGLLSGYVGGWVESVIMRIVDAMLAVPTMMLALAIVAILPPNLFNATLAVGVAGIARFTRLVRSSVLTVAAEPYIEAAAVVGCSHWRTALRHVLPNIVAPVIVLGTLFVAGAILTVAGLSFLGLGATANQIEWGGMLSKGREYLRDGWWISTFPGIAIVITVLSINLLGDALRDAWDPRFRHRV